jgi:hypothetical protein
MSFIKTAFFMKNVPGWERVLRLGLAAAAVIAAVMLGGTPGLLLGVAAAAFTATGLFGFCPMCALVGRRLPSQD